MVKQRIFLQPAVGLCFCLSVLCPAFVNALPSAFDEEVAQGDGDPSEEALLNVTAKEDVKEAEEDVATITAEGDFLVPTYLLPVAEDNATVVSKTDNGVSVAKTTTTTTTTTTKEVPVYVVSASSTSQSSTQGVAGVLDIVPVKDVHVRTVGIDKMPQADASGASKKETAVVHNIGAGYNAPKIVNQKNEHKTLVAPAAPSVSETLQSAQTRPILVPLAPLPKVTEAEPIVQPRMRKIVPLEYADKMLTALEENKRPDFIMPQEIKVSFYKNASHFSGQTIKWIKAFSASAMNDPRLVVQVRLSTQTPAVQQKRLSIIQNTLAGNGLSPHQIQIVFTNRPADSLVLRTVTKPELAQLSVSNTKIGRRSSKRTARW